MALFQLDAAASYLTLSDPVLEHRFSSVHMSLSHESLSHDYIIFGPPFDNSDTDVVLRSGFASVLAPGSTETCLIATDFLVHKLLLIKASSVFKSLLSSGSQTSYQRDAEALKYGIKCDTRGNLPVLCLSEDRDTVHRLLTAVYPVDVAYPRTFETIKTFAAARKYGMHSVLARFRTYCSREAPMVTVENSFRAYVLASNKGLKEEALEAVQMTLSLPLTFETYGSSLCYASGYALLALWKHRGMALRAIKRGVDRFLEEVGDLRDWKLNSPGNNDCCIVPPPHVRGTLTSFAEKIPQNFSMMNFFDFVQAISSQGVFYCASCKHQLRLDNLRLFDCLERHVRGQIEQASTKYLFLWVVITINNVLQIHDEFPLFFDGLGQAIDPQPSDGQLKDFGVPFDRGDSDVTIRSCDRVDFQVHKAMLGIASTAFEDMFTAPGPLPHGQEQVKQVIDLVECSKTLLQLLSAIYPMVPIIPDTLEDALSLLSACQKYQMDFITTRIRALIRARTPPLFTAENAFRAYGIASRYQLAEEALWAARLTLERSMNFGTCGEDLRFISGADLFRLFVYRNECTRDTKDRINEMTNNVSPPPSSTICFRMKFINYNAKAVQFTPRWWHGHFLSRVADQPSPKTVTDRLAFQSAKEWHIRMTGCSLCSKPDETMISNAICAGFEAKLSEVIEKVILRLTMSFVALLS
jgi:hypothetical protein